MVIGFIIAGVGFACMAGVLWKHRKADPRARFWTVMSTFCSVSFLVLACINS